MPHKVLITPNQFLNRGIAQRLLADLGVGAILEERDGSIRCQMTDQQLELFRLRGASHRCEVFLPTVQPWPDPLPPELMPPTPAPAPLEFRPDEIPEELAATNDILAEFVQADQYDDQQPDQEPDSAA